MRTILAYTAAAAIAGLVLLVVAWPSGPLRRAPAATAPPQPARTGQPQAVPTASPEPGAAGEPRPAPFTIVTVLPFDAIPSIDNPQLITVAEADPSFAPHERVLGISLNGEHHAYSVPMLGRHEIVNDVVGGVPVAVTW